MLIFPSKPPLYPAHSTQPVYPPPVFWINSNGFFCHQSQVPYLLSFLRLSMVISSQHSCIDQTITGKFIPPTQITSIVSAGFLIRTCGFPYIDPGMTSFPHTPSTKDGEIPIWSLFLLSPKIHRFSPIPFDEGVQFPRFT